MKKNLLYFLLLTSYFLFPVLPVAGQESTVRQRTREGNREYNAKHYDRAEVDYRRAIQADSTAYRAQHNLGNALYRTKNYAEAVRHYDMALREPSLDKKSRSDMLHNRGNCHLQAGLQKEDRAQGLEDFKQAVADYQEALKLNPKNDDTRYNLSYAMKMLQQAQQQQQQQGGGGDKNQQDKNNQDKKDQQNQQDKNGQDKKDQQNQQDQQQQNQQNQQDQQGQDGRQDQQEQRQQRQQQQGQQQKKQDAERLLEAVKNNEKNSMKEHAKKVEAGVPRRIEKDW